MKEKNKKIIYYKTYNDDVITNQNQNYKLKSNYKWIHNNILYSLLSNFLYAFAYLVSCIYFKLIANVKVENKKLLTKYKKQGYFLYGNHTRPIGDVFLPAYVNKGKRIYTIVSPANLGIKVIGRVLPMLGAIPTADNIKDTKKMWEAVNTRIKEKKCIVIYPEAHLWPYYTKIRPFQTTAFNFPVYNNVPSFAMTTTYYKRKLRKKPGIKIYIDGPFMPDNNIPKKEREEKLCKEIYECMENRCKNNTYEYIEYKREK